ncbi:unnamed protein product [Arctogadus glacialis]
MIRQAYTYGSFEMSFLLTHVAQNNPSSRQTGRVITERGSSSTSGEEEPLRLKALQRDVGETGRAGGGWGVVAGQGPMGRGGGWAEPGVGRA